jgi:hypothetical protein
MNHVSAVPALAHNASSATQELDDLMASLSDFKVSESILFYFFLSFFLCGVNLL